MTDSTPTISVPCPVCEGQGYNYVGHGMGMHPEQCPACRGKLSLQVEIPRGALREALAVARGYQGVCSAAEMGSSYYWNPILGKLANSLEALGTVSRVIPTDDTAADFPDDVARIVSVEDSLTPGQAHWLWGQYSYWMQAGWLVLPENDRELAGIIKGFLAGYTA